MIISQAIAWQWQAFEQLTVNQLYNLLVLRCQVFVAEQKCAYLDLDGIDQGANHCLGLIDSQLVAYLRCIPPSIHHAGLPALGRIVCDPAYRGQGFGEQLVGQGLLFCAQQWPGQAVFIAAQAHLQNFYHRFGFIKNSEPYDEDGIMHINMIKPG